MPSLVQRGSNFWLSCQFEFEPGKGEQLYSVKWYKNNEEFYRLLQFQNGPEAQGAQQQQQQQFSVPGANVMVSSSAEAPDGENAGASREGPFYAPELPLRLGPTLVSLKLAFGLADLIQRASSWRRIGPASLGPENGQRKFSSP